MQRDNPERIYARDRYVHGSARWADRNHLLSRGYGSNGRQSLAFDIPPNNRLPSQLITTSTKRHGSTFAPTRSGKGIATSVPICLEHQGSLVVIDPKDGELALITARYRRDVLGHKIILIDPFDCAASKLGMKASGFNMFEHIDPDGEYFIDDMFLLADSMVISTGSKDPFWAEEAKSLIAGLGMYVKVARLNFLPRPELGRSPAQIRAILNLPPKRFNHLVSGEFAEDKEGNQVLVKPGMLQSPNHHVSAAAGRIMSKAGKEKSSIISMAQSNTHFLEGKSTQKALSKSDFKPSELQNGKTDIYIIIPASRLATHHRFIRLVLSSLLIEAMRFTIKPDPPVFFLIEEMGALDYLEIIAVAYGLIAGYGVQIHTIWQDFSQLKSLYKEKWQTILANSGTIQCISTNDHMTADYLSKRCGQTTMEYLSELSVEMRASFWHDPEYFSKQDNVYSRALITPDEIMTMHPCAQLLLLAHAHPINAFKPVYFLDHRYRKKDGSPLFDIHPHYEDIPLPPPINFSKPGLDIGRVLHEYVTVG